jgi:hypothetical protein
VNFRGQLERFRILLDRLLEQPHERREDGTRRFGLRRDPGRRRGVALEACPRGTFGRRPHVLPGVSRVAREKAARATKGLGPLVTLGSRFAQHQTETTVSHDTATRARCCENATDGSRGTTRYADPRVPLSAPTFANGFLRQRLTPLDRSYACLLHELREIRADWIAELIVSADGDSGLAVVVRCSSVIVACSLWLVGCARSVVQ